MRKLLLVTLVGAFLMAASVCWSGIPHLIHYQGMLTDDEGTPLNTPQDLTFRIYNLESGGSSLWGETQNNVPVSDGLFSVLLGSVKPIDLPFDEDYWLEIEVSVYDTLLPRMKLASVGYAYRAERADTADWSDTSDYSFQAGRADSAEWSDTCDYGLKSQMADTANYAFFGPGVTDNDWLFRITDTADTTLTTGGAWGIARYGNTLYGNADSTHVNLGVESTTGTSGEDFPYCVVGGGLENTASGAFATVAGGGFNTASEVGAAIAGGGNNIASGLAAYVGGGEGNTASGGHATVGGGYQNTASDSLATVGGGSENTADSIAATVAGGMGNSASQVGATVAGGGFNTASGLGASVGGGEANTASGEIAAVAGGSGNTASGRYAAVPGGVSNTASGDYSFAAGRRAKANHHGTFLWADSTDADFASTGDNQFLIRASGGVGIGTTSPGADLDIVSANPNLRVGTTSGSPVITLDKASGSYWGYLEFREAGASKWQAGVSSDNNYYILNWPASKYVFYANSAGNVGIGTTNPTGQLDVNADDIRIRSSQTPASSSADGYTGEIAWDAGYIYICVSGDGPGGSADSWKRAQLSTWR